MLAGDSSAEPQPAGQRDTDHSISTRETTIHSLLLRHLAQCKSNNEKERMPQVTSDEYTKFFVNSSLQRFCTLNCDPEGKQCLTVGVASRQGTARRNERYLGPPSVKFLLSIPGLPSSSLPLHGFTPQANGIIGTFPLAYMRGMHRAFSQSQLSSVQELVLFGDSEAGNDEINLRVSTVPTQGVQREGGGADD